MGSYTCKNGQILRRSAIFRRPFFSRFGPFGVDWQKKISAKIFASKKLNFFFEIYRDDMIVSFLPGRGLKGHFFRPSTKWKGGQLILMKIKYVVLIGDLGKRVFYFCDFRPLRGLTGVTKFRDFGKFALDQDTFDGYNFFISRDNGIIPIVLER